MKTSQQWWNETKASPVKLAHWLQRQAYGEEQAYKRIEALAKKYNNSILHDIAKDELKHSLWITRYLQQSGIDFLNIHNERYWEEINLEFENIKQVGAVGYHAETMRLERIKVIAQDKDFITLADIFKKIQKDEEYHVKAFKDLTTEEAIEIAVIDHKQGMNSLGLIA